MRLIVLVEWGPKRWTKKLVAPFERLRVGRHERVELCVPHDDEMSGLHCELTWDGARCRLRDLGSAKGTFLNGERADAGELEHGDWLQAGETILSIYVEGKVPPWTPPHGIRRASQERRAEALVALKAEPLPLYAVLDTARDERILTLLRCSVEPASSLYDGDDGELIEDVAPFLVALPKGSWLLDRIMEEGWGERWGIFLTYERSFKELRRHLRKQLIVNVREKTEQLYFRFYDPRIMTAALTELPPGPRSALLGDVRSILVEDASGNLLRHG
jgi:Domain of unknown function (DUF4123)/FHA domain